MAITPIGNVTYVNQNSQVGSLHHANNMQKVDFMLNANMQDFVDKLKAIQEVNKAPETSAINPDRDSNNKQEQEEKQESKQNTQSIDAEVAEESTQISSYNLNILV